MVWYDVLHGLAAALTVLAAILIAVNASARLTIEGFIVFVFASISWIVAGWSDSSPSLVIQNTILLMVNIAGVYRWFPRAAAQSTEYN